MLWTIREWLWRLRYWCRKALTTNWYRWSLRKCMDCGVQLPRDYDRGDVCDKCFDEFDGLTIEEIME